MPLFNSLKLKLFGYTIISEIDIGNLFMKTDQILDSAGLGYFRDYVRAPMQ